QQLRVMPDQLPGKCLDVSKMLHATIPAASQIQTARPGDPVQCRKIMETVLRFPPIAAILPQLGIRMQPQGYIGGAQAQSAQRYISEASSPQGGQPVP